MKKSIAKQILACLFLALPLFSRADVLVEGDVDIEARIVNLDKFSQYEFFILYQDYYYDMGYQPGDIDTVWITDSKTFSTGDRGSSSKLYARLKSDPSVIFETKESIGGQTHVEDYDISNLVESVTIKKIKNGVITFKSSKEAVYPDGRKKPVSGASGGSFEIFGMNGMYLILSLSGLAVLALLFIWRRSLKKNSHAGAAV